MPELPEVETVKLALVPALQGRAVLSAFVGRKDLRWPLPENLAERLTKRQFTRLVRRRLVMNFLARSFKLFSKAEPARSRTRC